MSKEFQQFRCNSVASNQIGRSGLTKKAKAYARKCAYELAKQQRPERLGGWLHVIALGGLFVWADSPQGHKFWGCLV